MGRKGREREAGRRVLRDMETDACFFRSRKPTEVFVGLCMCENQMRAEARLALPTACVVLSIPSLGTSGSMLNWREGLEILEGRKNL